MKAMLFNWALSAKEVKLLYEHPILFRLKCFWSKVKRHILELIEKWHKSVK